MTAVGFEMKKPVLAIEGLTVSFDGFKAVDNLNLYIDRNEVRVVIGPNGAGKTTVLDLICGKTRATSSTRAITWALRLKNSAPHTLRPAG